LTDLVGREFLLGEATARAESLNSEEFLVDLWFFLRCLLTFILEVGVEIFKHLEREGVQTKVIDPLRMQLL
jgi:hypothetical protein